MLKAIEIDLVNLTNPPLTLKVFFYSVDLIMMEDRCKLPVQMELPEVNPLWDLVPLLFVGGNHDAHH